jgi:hypothetical protein
MTMQTVEGIVLNTGIGDLEEHETWETRMEKFVSLGNAYSSENTLTGEKCYMVDASLYRERKGCTGENDQKNEQEFRRDAG